MIVLRREGKDFIEQRAEEREDLIEKAKESGIKSFPVFFRGGDPLFGGFILDRIRAL